MMLTANNFTKTQNKSICAFLSRVSTNYRSFSTINFTTKCDNLTLKIDDQSPHSLLRCANDVQNKTSRYLLNLHNLSCSELTPMRINFASAPAPRRQTPSHHCRAFPNPKETLRSDMTFCVTYSGQNSYELPPQKKH